MNEAFGGYPSLRRGWISNLPTFVSSIGAGPILLLCCFRHGDDVVAYPKHLLHLPVLNIVPLLGSRSRPSAEICLKSGLYDFQPSGTLLGILNWYKVAATCHRSCVG